MISHHILHPRLPLVMAALLVSGLLCPVSSLAAGNSNASVASIFTEANRAYESGQFETARDQYLKALTYAPRNPTLEFNLANTYVRLEDIGRAVLHYERALRTNPRLDDALSNLRQVAPPSNFPSHSPLVAPFRWTYFRFNLNEWLMLSSVLFILACGSASLWILNTRGARIWKLLSMALGILFLLAAAFTATAVSNTTSPTGIVVEKETLARSGPGENYLQAMQLPAGANVRAADAPQRGWVKIRTPDGQIGFVPTGSVEWI